MTLNAAYAFTLELARHLQWPLSVAGAVALAVIGALALAAAIDLITGFRLTIPNEVIAEVEAIRQFDELESQKAGSIADYEHRTHQWLSARDSVGAPLINAGAEEAHCGPALSARFESAASRAELTAAGQ